MVEFQVIKKKAEPSPAARVLKEHGRRLLGPNFETACCVCQKSVFLPVIGEAKCCRHLYSQDEDNGMVVVCRCLYDAPKDCPVR